MNGIGATLRDAWRIALPYFARSDERWRGRLLLATILTLNLAAVGINVIFSYWSRAFFDSLQEKDFGAFIGLMVWGRWTDEVTMPGYVWLAALYIAISAYQTYLQQALQIRWRSWTTDVLVSEWLADRAYYRMSVTGNGTDNPDQRIAEDLAVFAALSLSLGLDLIRNVLTVISFVGILWTLSGAMTVAGVSIPGYMVWVCLIYAIGGSWLAHLIGRKLVPLNFEKQRVEADFRFALVRLRENTEGVALYGGEADEKAGLGARFLRLADNWWQIAKRQKTLNFFVYGYDRAAIVFPYLVAAPQFFAGTMTLGALQQTANAFSQVQVAMSWLVGVYDTVASWRATVERLSGFEHAIRTARATPSGIAAATAPAGEGIALDHLTLALPDGRRLFTADTRIAPGESVVVVGPSGAGKSTLFRALAGIWPFGAGRVVQPTESRLFLPQRPYIPLGTLRHAVAYPLAAETVDDAEIREALRLANLAHLLPRLDEEDNWAQRLSGGEQQRLAIARVLLVKPEWLFLDEATASLDPASEEAMYRLLKEKLPDTAIVSIAHRPAVATFHDRTLRVDKDAGMLVAA